MLLYSSALPYVFKFSLSYRRLMLINVQFGTAWSQQFVYRFVTMVRGILVTTIYRKTTNVSIVDLDDAAAVTLMSIDVERIVAGLAMMHEIWTTILQIGVSLFLLYRLVWVAIVVPLFMFIREYPSLLTAQV